MKSTRIRVRHTDRQRHGMANLHCFLQKIFVFVNRVANTERPMGVWMYRYSWIFAILVLANSSSSVGATQCTKDIGPDDFCGSYRADPKTTYLKASDGTMVPFEHVGGVSDLLGRLLPSDDAMREKYDWGISSAPGDRVPEELRNVQLDAYIVAVKPCEDDRDYHVIIKDENADEYMNVEVSGLPTNGVGLADFKRARGEIESVLTDANSSSTCGRYNKPDQPIHVRIEGSVYFDGDHRAGCQSGCPGPSYAKPSTVWEIHPVYSVTEIP